MRELVEQGLHLIILSGGLLAVMPMLLVLTLAVGLERWWLVRRTLHGGQRVQAALRSINDRDTDGLRALARERPETLGGHLVASALASRSQDAAQLDDCLEEEIMQAMPHLTRRMWVLDTAVTIAPLLGLFGTIIGMIQAFNVLSAHGGPAEVTGGIADALVSTGAGLLIAIVAVCLLNYLNSVLQGISQQLELIKLGLVNRCHGHGVGIARPQSAPARRIAALDAAS